MTQEPQKNNVVLIIIAIIGVVGTIVASIIGATANYNIEKLRQDSALTQIALVAVVTQGGATQVSMASTISAPTSTPLPTSTPVPTSTLQSTYTPYPTYTQAVIPIIPTSTNAPESNLIFEDNFDNGINTEYWQVFGSWMISDGNPVVVERYKSDKKFINSAFDGKGGLIFPGTAQMDNIAIEFDFAETGYPSMDVLLSCVDEYNYKRIYIEGSVNLDSSFSFFSNGNGMTIPESFFNFSKNNPNHTRIEIKGNSLNLYMNQKKIYDFKNLPDVVTGPIGFVMYFGSPGLLNFKVYQLH